QGSLGRVIQTNDAVLASGSWHHVAATFDVATQEIKIYVDGVAVPVSFLPGNDKTISAITPCRSPMRIGALVGDSGMPSDFWAGRIDEADIYSRALSAAEIQAIFAAGSRGKLALAQGVRVNLLSHTASGLTGGIANIQNVVGTAFNDILVGAGGGTLSGGAGRDILVAGASAATLYGGDDE